MASLSKRQKTLFNFFALSAQSKSADQSTDATHMHQIKQEKGRGSMAVVHSARSAAEQVHHHSLLASTSCQDPAEPRPAQLPSKLSDQQNHVLHNQNGTPERRLASDTDQQISETMAAAHDKVMQPPCCSSQDEINTEAETHTAANQEPNAYEQQVQSWMQQKCPHNLVLLSTIPPEIMVMTVVII